MLKVVSIYLVLLLIGCGEHEASSHSNMIVGKDQRHNLGPSELEQSVGNISLGSRQICAAFAIADYSVVTANHCVAEILEQDVGQLSFAIDHQEYQVLAIDRLPSSDLAILTLENVAHVPLRTLSIAAVNPDTAAILVAPSLYDQRLLQSEGIITRSTDIERKQHQALYMHEMDTTSGSSGAPILQNNKVVAVHLGAMPLSELNYAAGIFEAFGGMSTASVETQIMPEQAAATRGVVIGAMIVFLTKRGETTVDYFYNKILDKGWDYFFSDESKSKIEELQKQIEALKAENTRLKEASEAYERSYNREHQGGRPGTPNWIHPSLGYLGDGCRGQCPESANQSPMDIAARIDAEAINLMSLDAHKRDLTETEALWAVNEFIYGGGTENVRVISASACGMDPGGTVKGFGSTSNCPEGWSFDHEERHGHGDNAESTRYCRELPGPNSCMADVQKMLPLSEVKKRIRERVVLPSLHPTGVDTIFNAPLSRNECKARCDRDESCTAMVMTNSGHCYLKGGNVTGFTPWSEGYTEIPTMLFEHQAPVGGNLIHTGVMSSDQCLKGCIERADCSVMSFQNTTSGCYLSIGSRGHMQQDDSMISLQMRRTANRTCVGSGTYNLQNKYNGRFLSQDPSLLNSNVGPGEHWTLTDIGGCRYTIQSTFSGRRFLSQALNSYVYGAGPGEIWTMLQGPEGTYIKNELNGSYLSQAITSRISGVGPGEYWNLARE